MKTAEMYGYGCKGWIYERMCRVNRNRKSNKAQMNGNRYAEWIDSTASLVSNYKSIKSLSLSKFDTTFHYVFFICNTLSNTYIYRNDSKIDVIPRWYLIFLLRYENIRKLKISSRSLFELRLVFLFYVKILQ